MNYSAIFSSVENCFKFDVFSILKILRDCLENQVNKAFKLPKIKRSRY